MPIQEKNSKDDPQIHLLAAKYSDMIREIIPESANSEQIKVLKSVIQFFAHSIKYLPECNTDVLNMCRCFMTLIKNKSIDFDVSTVNRIIGTCTTMLIHRKEEDVIRKICAVLKYTLEMIPPTLLTAIVTKYSKTLSLIFQKIYCVQTYFTQLRVLEIFIFITKDLKKLLSDVMFKHPLMQKTKEEGIKIVIDKINKIDLNDFDVSAHKFLKFFNNVLFPKTCILSIEGRIIKLNNYGIKQKENMLINFNGRNLTVSFFIPNSIFANQGQKSKNDFMVFIEFECRSIESVSKEYKGKKYIDVTIEVAQAATYRIDMTRESLDEIQKISLRLIDEEATLNKFTGIFYEKFKQNERMMNDHTSGIDKMSIMTFQTSASLLDNAVSLNETKSQINVEIKTQKDEKPKCEQVQIKPQENNETAIKEEFIKETSAPKREKALPKQSQLKIRPRRQSARKANDKLSDIYDEENMEDDEKIVTSYRKFKTQQKNQEVKKNIDSRDDNRKFYLEPVQVKTRTTLKNRKPRASKHYDTEEEENIDVQRKEKATKKQEIKVQPKIVEQKERKPLINFDMIKNVTKENVDIKPKITKEQKIDVQHKKRKFIDSESSIDNNNDEMDVDPPIKVLKQSVKLKEAEKPSDDSYISGLSPNPVNYKEKASLKRPNEVETLQDIHIKKRRLTVDNVFEMSELDKEPTKIIESTSKVEEWLKSTSDSFSFDMSIEQNEQQQPPIYQNTAQVESCNVQNENADNESEMSFAHQYENDEHQHYSSSSHASMDLNVKNAVVDETSNLYPSTSLVSQNDYAMAENNNNNLFMDPCKTFTIRCNEAASALAIRKKKITEKDQNIFKKFDESIEKLGQKCLEQVQKTKVQLKHVNQLHLRYEAAKSKLMDELTEQEKMSQILKREMAKRSEAMELYNRNKKKELINLKKEALRKNEELMQDVWREYIDNFQTCFNKSIQKAYEI